MSKYDRLGAYLREQGMNEIRMTFTEIERVVGIKLPKSQKHQAWWSNSTSNNVMTKVWLDAGYETAQVDVTGQKLVFRRVSGSPPHGSGTSESADVKKQNRHPALGAMKGTFSIDQSWDRTKPTMSDEEIAEMEANLDRTADMIDAGMSGMSESAPEYKHADDAGKKKSRRSPLFGCMKGTFWIDPEWDLTKPTLSDEEMAEWDASLDRKAALYEEGRSRKPR